MGAGMDPRTLKVMELLTMEGHGIYVWGTYFLTAIVLVGLGCFPFIQLRRHKQRYHEDIELK